MIKNKREFEVEKDGVKVCLAVVKPSQAVKQRAELEYAKAWGNYVKESGILLETALWDTLKKKNLWDEDKQNKLNELDARILENEQMLPDEQGRVKKKGVTLSKARKAAIQIRIDRNERVKLLSDVTRLRSNTCEGLSDNARFNYLVSQCTIRADTGKAYFDSLDDYLEKSSELDAMKAAEEFAILFYGHDPDFDKSLPENVFLVKHKMADTNTLNLIGKDGEAVDIEGKPFDVSAEKGTDETFDVEDDWNIQVFENEQLSIKE